MDEDSDDYGSDIEFDDELLQILDNTLLTTTTADATAPPAPASELLQNAESDVVAFATDGREGAIVYPTLRPPSESTLYYDCDQTSSSDNDDFDGRYT